MELQDLLAPVAGEFDVAEALESWRWLVPQVVRPLVVTATGDLFMIAADDSVLFLDTIAGTCEQVASSVPEWEQALADPELLDGWFMPGFVVQLRDATPLTQGQCYSATHPPVLGGAYTVDNWSPTHWRVHFSHSGRMHEAIKDLPDGAVITDWKYTKLPTSETSQLAAQSVEAHTLVEGGLYAQRTGWLRWTVLKILKIEDDVIHVRTYANRFWRRPSLTALAALEWSIGHMPFARSVVENWRLEHITTQPVSHGELEGYRRWASEENAGVWS